MLPRQQRRRHDHCHLRAGHRRDKGGAQRHLGLAKPDIAADQPIHRLARSHVGERVGDRVELVLGLGVGEARGEFLVDPLGRLQDVAGPQLAFGGDTDQLAGNVANAFLDPRLARLPSDASEAVELRPGVFRAEARQDLDILDRHVEFVVTRVKQAHAVVRRTGDVDRLQRLVAADPVIGMDDEIAGCQRRRLCDELVEAAPAPRRAGEPVAEDILLAEQNHIVGRKALLDRQHGEPDGRTRQRLESPAVGDPAQIGDAALAKYGQQPVGRSGAERGDRYFAAGFPLGFEIIAHRLEQHDIRVGALGCEILRRAGTGIERVALAPICCKRRELDDRPPVQGSLPFPAVEIELVGADRAINRRTGRAPRE